MIGTPLQTPRVSQEQVPRTQLAIPVPIDVVQVQSTTTTVFTARDDADLDIDHLVATNVTAAADWITVYLVPSGGSAGVANTIVYQKTIPAKSGITIFNAQHRGLLQPSAILQAVCSTNDAVNIWGRGYEYQGEYG